MEYGHCARCGGKKKVGKGLRGSVLDSVYSDKRVSETFFFRRTERNVRNSWGKPTSYEHVKKYNWKNEVR